MEHHFLQKKWLFLEQSRAKFEYNANLKSLKFDMLVCSIDAPMLCQMKTSNAVPDIIGKSRNYSLPFWGPRWLHSKIKQNWLCELVGGPTGQFAMSKILASQHLLIYYLLLYFILLQECVFHWYLKLSFDMCGQFDWILDDWHRRMRNLGSGDRR